MKNTPPVSLALTKLNTPHRVFEHQHPIKNMEQAAAERGQDVSQLVRSILFRSGRDEFVLVLVAGPTQLSWPALRTHLGVSRMTMASKDEVLQVTGYQIGTVAPIGLLRPVRLLADKNVFAHEEISIGSGVHNTAIMIKTKDFRAALDEVEVGNFANPSQ
ncbi:MAG: YbaK/EbsC family protein [Anaerolineales bacterium]|nr:YbaK/EbsC family protein [Anaerolineales bacterium]